MMEKIGRLAVYSALLYAFYFVGRLIWDFPLDPPTYWFALGYSLVSTVVYDLVVKK